MTFVATRYSRRNIQAKHRQHSGDARRTIAEAVEPHMRDALLSTFQEARRLVTPSLVRAGMNNDDLMARLKPALSKLSAGMRSSKMFLASAHMHSHFIGSSRIDRTVRKASVNFDLETLPQPTQDALDEYDFGLIRDTDSATKEAVGAIIDRGMREGWSAPKMARALQGSIGLTQSQQDAVANFRDLLENGSPDALTRELRDARYDGTVQDAVDGVKELSPDQIDTMVGRYQDRYLALRANTIARYESLRASNQGYQDAVQSAIDDGSLDPSDVTKTWMIADDEITCPACRSIIELQPDGVGYDSEFQWAVPSKKGERSGSIDLAPLHPDCRCTNGFEIAGQGDTSDDQE